MVTGEIIETKIAESMKLGLNSIFLKVESETDKKELEQMLYGSNSETTSLLNRINNFFTEDAKARNLVEDCYKCIHQLLAVISKMETTQKWISVKDRLPEGNPKGVGVFWVQTRGFLGAKSPWNPHKIRALA